MAVIQQGDIWWGAPADEKPRPYLVITRQRAIDAMRAVSVAPVTRRVRGLVSEVVLGPADGVKVECVANFDNIRSLDKSLLTRRAGSLAPGRWHEVCAAVRAAIDC
ncbi:MAG TPA: type II toxin-antitoxin system PemK/MazF family toxin [Ilumatobacteraceae bacterium]|nr:type II toxin-antitoxin system PemK/MazF family toxin [Ilumatobacteraceae bacterium]